MDKGAEARRAHSVEVVRRLGLPVPPVHLPVIDGSVVRSGLDVVQRIACLSAVAATAYGCAPEVALGWLDEQGLTALLAGTERRYLQQREHSAHDDEAARPEAIYALAWALGLAEGADELLRPAPDDLVRRVPHPPPASVGVDDIDYGVIRRSDEVTQALDTAYCCHWALVDGRLQGRPQAAPEEWVVVERRRAWEWLTSHDEWDDVPMDT